MNPMEGSVERYCIADCTMFIHGEDLCRAVAQMPGFEPFRMHQSDAEIGEQSVPPFHVYLSASSDVEELQHQYTFESDGVDSEFSAIKGGHLLAMRHNDGSHLNLYSDIEHRMIYLEGNLLPQMLRFALWTGFGLMTVGYGRIPIHGSCIINNERAYLFLGESGTGKSTHTRLWREYIGGSTLLNDDSPIIVAKADGVTIYGSPWSGKTPCYKPLHFPLGGCVRLSQAPYNQMSRLNPLHAYAAIHPSCPPEFAYDEGLYAGISDTLDHLLSQVPIYHLACLPDQEAAKLSYETLTGKVN